MELWRSGSTGAFALALVLSLAGCGDDGGGTAGSGGSGGGMGGADGTGGTTSDGPAVIELIEVETLDVLNEDQEFQVLHPMNVEATIALNAEGHRSAVAFVLRSESDGTLGCLLGTLSLDHEVQVTHADDPEIDEFAVAGELILPKACEVLVGVDDVVMDLAYDIFQDHDIVGRDEDANLSIVAEDLFLGLVQHDDFLSMENCRPAQTTTDHPDDCQFPITVAANQGIELVMTDLQVDSSVGIHEIAIGELPERTADEVAASIAALPTDLQDEVSQDGTTAPAHVAPLVTHPLFTLSTTYRLLGVEPEVEIGEVDFEFLIRPNPRASELTPEQDVVLPLAIQDANGDLLLVDRSDAHADNHHRARSFPIVVTEDVDAFLTGGEWRLLTDFIVEVCAAPSEQFEERDLAGLEEQNNCAELDVQLVRRAVFAEPDDGEVHLHGSLPTRGHLASFAAIEDPTTDPDVTASGRFSINTSNWSKSDSSGDFGIAVGAGWDVAGTNTSSSQAVYSHSVISGPAGWAAAQAFASATVFSQTFDIFRFEAAFMDYTAGNTNTDAFGLIFRLFAVDFFAFRTNGWEIDDGTVTLGDILDVVNAATGGDYAVEYTWSKSLLGTDFNVDCGGASASLDAFVTVGLNSDETSITKSPRESSPGACGTGTVHFPADLLPSYGSTDCIKVQTVIPFFTGAQVTCALLGGTLADVAFAPGTTYLQNIVDDLMTVVPLAWVDHYYGWDCSNESANCPDGTGTPECWSEFPGGALNDVAVDAWGTDYPTNTTTCEDGETSVAAVLYNGDALLYQVDPFTIIPWALCRFADTEGVTLGGTDISLTVTPFIAGGLSGEVSADFGSVVSLSLSITLNLVEFDLPVTTTIGYDFAANGTVTGTLSLQVGAELTALSGCITASISWDTGSWGHSGTHTKTLVEWDGVDLGSWNLYGPAGVSFTK